MRDTPFHSLFDAEAWHRLNDYLDQALDLEPPERERWLAEISNTEPNIAATIRDLLARNDALDADHFLEKAPLAMLSELASGHTGKEGERIGAYTLERLIGRGGVGEVWLASRSDGRFEGQCAIKFLDKLAGHGRVVQRFRHEGRFLARLTHPNISRLVDAGSTDDGRQYLAIEYVDGVPIHQYCSFNALPTADRVRLFRDVVSAVATAHANLIIHRDIKPTNVLVTRDGTPKLLDFGIAKLLGPDITGDDSCVTRFEEAALTPEYAAPEQLLGDVPSTATDVYQLGMLLYVLLTERHPVKFCGGRAERMKAALDGRVPLASEFAPASLRRQLRGDLDAILAKALRRDPRERYATAEALREDLTRYLDGEPVNARRGAQMYLMRKFVERHRYAVLGSVVGVLSLCAALMFAFSQARAAASQRDRAYALVTRNEAVTQFLGTVITEAAESAKPVTVKDMVTRSEALALADTSSSRENRAAVLQMMGSYYQELNDHPRAAHLFDRALAVLTDSPEHDQRSFITCLRAVAIGNMGQNDVALSAVDRELANPPQDTVAAAECMHSRAIIAINLDDAENALKYAMLGLARIRADTGRASKVLDATFLATVASAYHLNGRHREAFDYYGQALRAFQEAGRNTSPGALTIRNNWAVSSAAAGVPKRALELYDEIAQIAQDTDPERPRPHVALNRGRALESIGRYREALENYTLALRLNRQVKSRAGELYTLIGLADVSLALGDRAGAERFITEMSRVMGASEPEDSLPSMRLAISRGYFALSNGAADEALAQFKRGLIGKRSKASTIDVLLGKAEAELVTADIRASIEDSRIALDNSVGLQGGLPYSRRTGLSWLMLGRGLRAEGDGTEARKAGQHAVTHLQNTVDADHPALILARGMLQ